MLEQSRVFGAELRRRRIAAGLTLTDFASSVHYSKGQISKIENSRKKPSQELARLCDAALDADGQLCCLVPSSRAMSSARAERDAEGSGIGRDPDRDRPSRRRVLTAGAASAIALGTSAPAGAASPPLAPSPQRQPPAGPPSVALLESSTALLLQYRRLGQVAAPDAVLPALSAQTRSLSSLAASGTGSRTARDTLALASRYAEFTGWMSQEAGDNSTALYWTDHAVALAEESGDDDLAGYALVRRALMTYYAGDAESTVALARRARGGRLPARIRGLAAQRVAQGHALGGEYDACMRALDQARELLARSTVEDGGPVLGPTHLGDPVSMITGWCLFDLGRPSQAGQVLDRELLTVPAHALRTHARYGVRRALSHATAGELEHACTLTDQLLRTTAGVRSATVDMDLRRLARVLGRHSQHPAVLALSPHLAAALAPSARDRS
ncbi:helix-turn-helix domain-containing protein [Streptomyces tsukubensis]|uniref:Transcriptional regulator n=1 Tax=Streptomyces tsukubensis TaxID=83656 RepID=A0A1V4AGB0_9ACTN|nr:helix-turn-helix transcriptional regulator [Streptomyces tsukubensis]OON82409.1 transcriptional regulator [Streptomyces tsukubensis]QFR92570.1 helix-turn-helix domain-containing protein [Streptomyces tsukubensis]